MPNIRHLPEPLTRLIGRERETRQIADLLNRPSSRHVSLCGPGGIGKTRLALRVAQLVADDFGEGVVFVDLSPLTDPDLVATRIAEALDVTPVSTQTIEETLIETLADQSLLIVLDNFEHLMPAAPIVPLLAGHCEELVFLVTSRERLGTSGEWVIEIEPMSLPAWAPPRSVADVASSESVHLFVERATAANGDFTLTDDNVASVASICRRLNGLPLAIELAAARIAHLSPHDIDANFERLLPLLEGGGRELPPRRRSMREAIRWSYRLLTPEEQALFCRLSVFSGGCTLDAAGAVAFPTSEVEPAEVLALLASLVDKRVLKRERQTDLEQLEQRYTTLETVREFGLEELALRHQDSETRNAHAGYFLRLAEQIRPELRSGDPGPWLRRLEAEMDNFRAALTWLLQSGQAGESAVAKLCNGLAHFWLWRGHTLEAKMWLQRAVERAHGTVSEETAAAYLQLGHLGYGDAAESYHNYERSLAIFRELGHQRGIAGLLTCLGMVAEQMGKYDEARSQLMESLALFEQMEDRNGIAQSSFHLGTLASCTGEFRRAQRYLDTARGLWEQLGDEANVAFAIEELGRLYRLQRRPDEATDFLVWSLSRLEQAGITHGQGLLHYDLGEVAMLRGDLAHAAEEFRTALRLLRETDLIENAYADSIEGLAHIAAAWNQPALAMELHSAVVAWRTATGYRSAPYEESQRDKSLQSLRRALGNTSADVAWTRGQLMKLGAASELASSLDTPYMDSKRAETRQSLPGTEQLTKQESVVLCLIASGLSNQQIANQLSITIRTATTHVSRIFDKLGVNSRTHAAALAYHHHLCPGSGPADPERENDRH